MHCNNAFVYSIRRVESHNPRMMFTRTLDAALFSRTDTVRRASERCADQRGMTHGLHLAVRRQAPSHRLAEEVTSRDENRAPLWRNARTVHRAYLHTTSAKRDSLSAKERELWWPWDSAAPRGRAGKRQCQAGGGRVLTTGDRGWAGMPTVVQPTSPSRPPSYHRLLSASPSSPSPLLRHAAGQPASSHAIVGDGGRPRRVGQVGQANRLYGHHAQCPTVTTDDFVSGNGPLPFVQPSCCHRVWHNTASASDCPARPATAHSRTASSAAQGLLCSSSGGQVDALWRWLDSLWLVGYHVADPRLRCDDVQRSTRGQGPFGAFGHASRAGRSKTVACPQPFC